MVFVISVAAVGVTAEALVTRALKLQAGQRVEGEAAELLDEFRQYGSDAFRKLIDAQTASGESRLHYALLGRDGQRVAGEHLVARAAASVPAAGASTLAEIRLTGSDRFLLNLRSLTDGTTLVVADDLGSVDDVEDVVANAFTIVLGISVLLGLVAGFLLTKGVLWRVEAVTRTAEAIIAGDMTRRIEPTGAGDEFDRLATSLNAMLDRIMQLMDSLQQVSNDIAHDLRTPLSRLRQNLERTRIHPATTQDYAVAVERAIDEADGLLATFSALLRISQVEAGNQRVTFRPVDLTEVVTTLFEAYAPDVEEGGRILTCAVAPGIVIDGDRELLAQLLANLIENALAHTPLGTEIRVSLLRPGRAERGPAIEVADDGPGIPAAERDKVLRRFYRLERSRTTPGNGLGLSLVAAIAKLHGAALRLSDPEPGLRVTIAFPWRLHVEATTGQTAPLGSSGTSVSGSSLDPAMMHHT
ncbi:HAMP domain-containing sensor histidine kinase [Methylobacterium sp. NEAU K]|uniref:HAMP domain-containing sensor histidine kinase n=1 Tax=Methylobacterium sp. NEAU K TaxID=3064946 RepID=UPI00273572D0|nr:HAMP domain-containing sensor histidine kinase [Methylobacterium sp. NEAU K]MDP4003543.1 HAMP domain-containing sensor histidine kinase [Methylobacterium sp. NEAU K]